MSFERLVEWARAERTRLCKKGWKPSFALLFTLENVTIRRMKRLCNDMTIQDCKSCTNQYRGRCPTFVTCMFIADMILMCRVCEFLSKEIGKHHDLSVIM